MPGVRPSAGLSRLSRMTGPTHRAYDVLRAAMANEGGTWTTGRALQLLTAAGLTVNRNDAWGLVRHLTLNPPRTAATWQQDELTWST